MNKAFPNPAGFSPLGHLARVRFHQALPERPRVLHVGCGDGSDLLFFSNNGCRVAGTDPSDANLRLCRGKFPAGISLRRMTAQEFSDPQGTWDGIWVPEALSTVPMNRQVSVLSALIRSLSSGGVLMARIGSGTIQAGNGVTLYDQAFARTCLREASLRVPCFTSVTPGPDRTGGASVEMMAVRM